MDKKVLVKCLRSTEFRFAKTYAQTFPHEYIVKDQHPEIFTEMAELIEKEGFEQDFQGRRYRYFNLDGYKYWIIDNILNREPLTGYTPEQIDQHLNP